MHLIGDPVTAAVGTYLILNSLLDDPVIMLLLEHT